MNSWLYLFAKFTSEAILVELFALCIAIIILAIVEDRWIGSKFWALKPLRLTGRVSYGIYLAVEKPCARLRKRLNA